MNTYEPGQDVDALCSKCKMTLAHVIIAVKGARIMKVECKTCRGTHTYRSTAKATTKTTKPRKTAAGGTKTKVKNNQNFLENRDLSTARTYRLDEEFSTNDVINHKNFGLGLVTKELADQKIEVMFTEGAKVLAHGRDPYLKPQPLP